MVGSLFPFLFITIACGAVPGFHALISSGTTPKLLDNEKHARMIGYGGMLMETVLIFGGSLGARTINEAVLAHADTLAQMQDVNIVWQVGNAYYEEYRNCSLAERPDTKILAFIEDMDIAYSAADVVVCRAGALTISELAILGTAAILIPSPNVAEDHQTVNAMSLVNKGAAVLVKDVEAKDKLIQELQYLLKDEVRKTGLEVNIKYFARPEAAKMIAAEILKLCTNRYP